MHYLYAYDPDGDQYGGHVLKTWSIADDGTITYLRDQTLVMPATRWGSGPYVRQNLVADEGDAYILPGQPAPVDLPATNGWFTVPIFHAAIGGDGSFGTLSMVGQDTTQLNDAGLAHAQGAASLRRRGGAVDLVLGSGAVRTASGWTCLYGNAVSVFDCDPAITNTFYHTDAGFIGSRTGPDALWALGGYVYTAGSRDQTGLWTPSPTNCRYPLAMAGTTPDYPVIGARDATTNAVYTETHPTARNRYWQTADGLYTYTLQPVANQTTGPTRLYTVYRHTMGWTPPTAYNAALAVNAGSNGDVVNDIAFLFLKASKLTAAVDITRSGKRQYRLYQGTFSDVDFGAAVVLSPLGNPFDAPTVKAFGNYTTDGTYVYATNLPHPVVSFSTEVPAVVVTQYDGTPAGGVLTIQGTASHSLGIDDIRLCLSAPDKGVWGLPGFAYPNAYGTLTPDTPLASRPTSVNFTLTFDPAALIGTGDINGCTFSVSAAHQSVVGNLDTALWGQSPTYTFLYDKTAPAITGITFSTPYPSVAPVPYQYTRIQVNDTRQSDLVKVETAETAHGVAPVSGDWTVLYNSSTDSTPGAPPRSYAPGVSTFDRTVQTADLSAEAGTVTHDLYVRATDGAGNATTSAAQPFSVNADGSPVALSITNTTLACAFGGPYPALGDPKPWTGLLQGATTGGNRTLKIYYARLEVVSLFTYQYTEKSAVVGTYTPSPADWSVDEDALTALMQAMDGGVRPLYLPAGTDFYLELTDNDTGDTTYYPSGVRWAGAQAGWKPNVFTPVVDHSGPTLSGGLVTRSTFDAQFPAFPMSIVDTPSGVSTTGAIQFYFKVAGVWEARPNYLKSVTVLAPAGETTYGTALALQVQIQDLLVSYPSVSIFNGWDYVRMVVTDRCGNVTDRTFAVHVVNAGTPTVRDVTVWQSFEPGNP